MRAIGVGATRDLAVAIPIADDEPIEAEFAAQDIGQQRLVAMHLFAVDRIEAGHDRFHTGSDGCRVGRGVDRLQRFDIAGDFTLIHALIGAAIAEKMFRCGNHMPRAETVRVALATLEAFDQRCAQGRDDCRILGVAFVGATPPVILSDGDRGREVPVDPGDLDFHCGRFADAANEVGIARGAERNVVREDRGADYIGMAMNGIGAPHGRNDRFAAWHRFDGGKIHLVSEFEPFTRFGVFVAIRPAIAAIQIAAEPIAAHVFCGETVDLGLYQLSNLAFDAHARNQVCYAGIFARVGGLSHRKIFNTGLRHGASSQSNTGSGGPQERFHTLSPRDPDLFGNVIN